MTTLRAVVIESLNGGPLPASALTVSPPLSRPVLTNSINRREPCWSQPAIRLPVPEQTRRRGWTILETLGRYRGLKLGGGRPLKQAKKAKHSDPKASVLFPRVGLLVGTDSIHKPQGGWILTRDENVLILGSTRSEKSRRLIIPTVGIIGSTGQESLLISDPKGEIYEHTADWLKTRGYHVIRLDLINPKPGHSARYNPLALV